MTQTDLDDITRVGRRVPGRFSIHIGVAEYKALCACTGHLHHCNPRRYYRSIFGRKFKGIVVCRIDYQYYSLKRIKPKTHRLKPTTLNFTFRFKTRFKRNTRPLQELGYLKRPKLTYKTNRKYKRPKHRRKH